MAKNKKQKENKPIIIDDLENVFGSDEMEVNCKHCGSSFVLIKGFDEDYCSQECMEADNEE